MIGPLYLWLLPVCLSDSLLIIDGVTAVITHILLLISIAHTDRHKHNVLPCPVCLCVFLDLVLQIRPQLCALPLPSCFCLNFDSFTAIKTHRAESAASQRLAQKENQAERQGPIRG